MSTMCDKWLWQRSGYDGRVHAFERADGEASFVEAVCSHSVPVDKLVRCYEGMRCVACLLIVGDHLAEHHRSGVAFQGCPQPVDNPVHSLWSRPSSRDQPGRRRHTDDMSTSP